MPHMIRVRFGGYVWTRLKIRNKIFVKNIRVYLEYLHIEYEFSNKYFFLNFDEQIEN